MTSTGAPAQERGFGSEQLWVFKASERQAPRGFIFKFC